MTPAEPAEDREPTFPEGRSPTVDELRGPQLVKFARDLAIAVDKEKKRSLELEQTNRKLGETQGRLERANQQAMIFARDLQKIHRKLEENVLATLRVLATALEARDPYTEGHSRRVSRYSLRIGLKMGLSPKALHQMGEAGILHDIGKIGVRDIVLHKPGPLTDEEYEEIQGHPEQGCHILQGLDFLEFAIPYVRHHHERWDGRGYPARLAGEAIPPGARIMAVADSYDAMTSSRPYRDAMPAEQAIAQIRQGAGTQFDPKVAAAFLALAEAGMLLDEEVPVEGTEVGR